MIEIVYANIPMFNWLFFICKERIPLYVAIVYMVFKRSNPSYPQLLEVFSYATVLLLSFLMMYIVYGLVNGIHFHDHMMIKWNYAGALSWLVFCITSFIYANGRTRDPVFSLNYIIQGASFGGLLYELPIFPHIGVSLISIFDLKRSRVFFLEFQLISGLILAYSLLDKKVKINRWVSVAFLGFLVYSILCYTNRIYSLSTWFMRIPAIFLLFSFLTGIDSITSLRGHLNET